MSDERRDRGLGHRSVFRRAASPFAALASLSKPLEATAVAAVSRSASGMAGSSESQNATRSSGTCAIHQSAPRSAASSHEASSGAEKIAHDGKQDAPGLRAAPGAGRAVALVRVVLDQPAGRIERRGLDERIVGAPVQRDDGRGVSTRDLTHLFVAGGARRPEQERRGVQAVDAGLNVADVPAFLGLASQRNELQRRTCTSLPRLQGAGERELVFALPSSV